LTRKCESGFMLSYSCLLSAHQKELQIINEIRSSKI